jgi:hypothetical protein
MNFQPLTLTVDRFLLGPQEIVLMHRHACSDAGRKPEIPGATIRRTMKEALQSREIHARVTLEVQNLGSTL